MTITRSTILRWRAVNRSGCAHAFAARRQPALCGIGNQEERYDWPKRFRCPDCSLIAQSPEAGAL